MALNEDLPPAAHFVDEGARRAIVDELRREVGRRVVRTDTRSLDAHARGYRFGFGRLSAVVIPNSLFQMWRALQICLKHDGIVIMQAANTGLTGGSTPHGSYDRPVVLINTLQLDTIHVLDDGKQVVCLPGATLNALTKRLLPFGREPHSVIGSSCIGASVVGGVCNNSGGALVRRGPAFTEMALFAQCDARNSLTLIDHLELDLPDLIEAKFKKLERVSEPLVSKSPIGRRGSLRDYEAHVRDLTSPTPARFNADPRGLFEASGCAGKIAVFAVRLDTFPVDGRQRTFYIGTNAPDRFTLLRRRALSELRDLPVSAEYIHSGAFDLARSRGKIVFLLILLFGTDRIPLFNKLQLRAERLSLRLGLKAGSIDRLLDWLASRLPNHLPKRMLSFRQRFDHHLLLQMADDGIDEMQELLEELCSDGAVEFFVCNQQESRRAFLHRFAVATAAVRQRSAERSSIEGLVAIDVALPRNTEDWFAAIAVDDARLECSILYGHFFCQVFHLDFLLKIGRDLNCFEESVLGRLNSFGAECPAEHNVGHCYAAKPALAAFYKLLDPRNMFNPGIGRTAPTAVRSEQRSEAPCSESNCAD